MVNSRGETIPSVNMENEPFSLTPKCAHHERSQGTNILTSCRHRKEQKPIKAHHSIGRFALPMVGEPITALVSHTFSFSSKAPNDKVHKYSSVAFSLRVGQCRSSKQLSVWGGLANHFHARVIPRPMQGHVSGYKSN